MVLPIIESVLTLNGAEFEYVSCKKKRPRTAGVLLIAARYLLLVVAITFSAGRFFAIRASREDGASCRPNSPSPQRTSLRKFCSPYRLKISRLFGVPGRL